MAVVSSLCKKLTSELIQTITGFTPEEENYDRCYQFCMSNFKYHRYLTVDNGRVARQLVNLSTKFRIHSYPERADKLDSLTSRFLQLSLINSFSESDTHYSILLYLLCLSHSPTNVDYAVTPEPVITHKLIKEKDFDWGRYLMEGVVLPSFDDSSTDSDSEYIICSDNDEAEPVKELLHDSAIECSDTEQEAVVTSPQYKFMSRPYWLPYHCGSHHRVVITESQAVRESLWVLLGAKSSFLYTIKEDVVSINSNASVFHLTPNSLDNILKKFAHLATELLKLRNVVMTTQFTMDTEPTVQAYSNALLCYLKSIDCKLHHTEQIVSKKKEFVSLLQLSNDLNDTCIEVFCIGSISCFMNTKELLDKLWLLLRTYDTIGPAGMGVVKVLFPLFVMTVQPYVVTLDKWMTSGILHDPLKEFFIQHNIDSVIGNPSYWNDCYQCSNVPLCFQDIANQVLIAGRSCHLSVLLKGSSIKSSTNESLYMRFLSYFLPEEETNEPVIVETDFVRESPLVLLSADPVLCKAVVSLTHQPPSLIIDNSVQFYSSLKEAAPLISSSNDISQSIDTYISTALKTILTDQFNQSSKVLTDLLKTEYNLLQHFNNIQNVLLMASGDCMHHFSSTLFCHIQGTNITESSFLVNILHEALQERHYHLLKFISVDITQPITIALDSLSNITVNYEVPWPVNLLFPQSVLTVYNTVFRFLLQLKYSRWCLDQIWLNIRDGKVNSVLMHKVSLLRAKLLHFVVSINHYILTRILHSSGLEFYNQVESCHDLDTLLSLHHQYVSTIHDRCILNKKAQFVKEAIMKILLLVLKFYHKCLNTESFSYNDGVNIEEDFSKCSHFLISCLNSHIKRGSFPHLETLSFSLSSLLSGTKIFFA